MIRRAYLSIGTNIGNRCDNLQRALQLLVKNPAIQLTAVSPLYQTEPVGPVKQRSFYNLGLALNTSLTALELLDWCHVVEQSLHRRRLIHWGPRTIDLDIIFYQHQVIELPRLVVPHPEAANRRFVIQPLLDVSQDDPQTQRQLELMLKQTRDTNWVHRLDDQGVTI
ncbi:2-amino-4-hydroxy-6-hydroxymethyldihydropteridine diphosphokinase [uncultured Limosilactobacillus sp.]|uniref:2-amino-4-hydroxy-6- hydroxymethyldihydropteridine diphosphokinase n=1 Tax=uncultured Limosilactobacillus sp. TaxID=2837629 RepID=UPI0025FE5D95|nr:2-amino-4-hydroxy-6-hydroxymethyldihydropteridine diphosphokinase [uncultured Limosilactobacillus sp.]